MYCLSLQGIFFRRHLIFKNTRYTICLFQAITGKAGSMSLRSLRALCLTSFFIADVRDGLGPFLGIF
jgi:hypothetical protein